METIKGYVEKIIYKKEETGYTVLSLEIEDDDLVCVGNFQFVKGGEYLEITGEYIFHRLYGEQFVMSSYEIKTPESEKDIERYLASGAIKGLGAALAARIVKKFGKDAFRIIEEETERLAEIKGISEKKAREIANQIEEEKDMRQAMIFLQKYGISSAMTVKIYNHYGPGVYQIINNNPYRLAEDINGIGFKMADEIACKIGISMDSEYRIKCALLYQLLQGAQNGNVYLPKNELVQQTEDLLGIERSIIDKCIVDMAMERKIIIKGEEQQIYNANNYYVELNIAKKLSEINLKDNYSKKEIEEIILKIEDKTGIVLDELQKKAVFEALNSGLLIITGGPGTGKTTTINTIIKLFETQGMDIILAAPTGRAAKRMTEATGYEAKTIHRLLEINGGIEGTKEGVRFERNEENPLDTDLIIIDEMSMVDIFLMNALVKAIPVGTRLVLVGDTDQLPSVGPGNVLKDIIESEVFNVVKLTKIFRQAIESEIVVNAHKINRGEHIELRASSRDFIYLKREDPNRIISAMITLVKEKLPDYVKTDIFSIQILTPMKKGNLGVEKINEILQQHLNPPEKGKTEIETAGTVFRVGDKVMHIKNNYQLEWECRGKYGIPYEAGTGVFNGETGVIRKINEHTQMVEVEYDENKFVIYTFKQLEELELAYAVTVHKSQGSEYPAVILPLLTGPKMLMNKNVLYTAVTRAKTCVCVVGSSNMFNEMINNISEAKRYSGLKDRIEEIACII